MPNDPRFEQTVDQLRHLASSGGAGGPPPIEPQSQQPDDPHMEARRKRVEDDVRAIRGDMTGLLVRQGAVEGRLGLLEGKVDGLIRQVDRLGRQISDLGTTLRTKVVGPWQALGLVIGLLTAALTLPVATSRLLALIP